MRLLRMPLHGEIGDPVGVPGGRDYRLLDGPRLRDVPSENDDGIRLSDDAVPNAASGEVNRNGID